VYVYANFVDSAPDTYEVLVKLATNIMQCDGTQLIVTIPWAIQVTDLLFVPPSVSVNLSPDMSTGVLGNFSLANFAGSHAACNLTVVSSAQNVSFSVIPAGLFVPIGALLPIGVRVSYPGSHSDAGMRFVVRLSSHCISGSGVVLGVSHAQLEVQLTSGNPSALTSSVALLSETQFQRGSRMLLRLSVKDVASNPLNGTDVVSSVIRVLLELNSGDVVTIGFSELFTVTKSSAAFDYFVGILDTASFPTGPHAVSVSLEDTVLLRQPIEVLGFVCPATLTLPDPLSVACVCDAGLYQAASACERCPAGTYKRAAGNSTIAGCVACPEDWVL
jgi:hypothetical protein